MTYIKRPLCWLVTAVLVAVVIVIAAVQSQVTGVDVKPSLYRPERYIALFLACFSVSIFSGFLGMHVAGQFSLPSSRLAPNFRGSHYLVAGLLFTALVVLLTRTMASIGTNVLTTISLILLPGAFYLWSSTQLPQAKSMSPWAIWLSSLSIGLLSLVVPLSLIYRPMLVEDFLMSEQVLISLSFIAVAAWLLRLTYQNLETRLAMRLERGIPATLSLHDVQAAQAASLARRYDQTDESPHAHLKIFMKLPIVAKAVLGMTPLVVGLLVSEGVDGGRGVAVVCFGAAVVAVYLIGVKWWKEMPFFASAITRPPNREGHVDRLMRGVAKDFAGIAPLFIVGIIAVSLAGDLRLEGIGYRIATGVVVVSSVSIAVYAVILWSIALRSIIGVIVLALGCCILYARVTTVLLVPAHRFATSWKTFEIVVTACIISVFAVAAIILARRYFHRIEWARFL